MPNAAVLFLGNEASSVAAVKYLLQQGAAAGVGTTGAGAAASQQGAGTEVAYLSTSLSIPSRHRPLPAATGNDEQRSAAQLLRSPLPDSDVHPSTWEARISSSQMYEMKADDVQH
ncbi:hypothetical protein HXX76_004865 [Chlamydomonas incerta]|uniref:Uncharacterized protein n=1 Tax=Chlamydomonas incerta TaxID=51695 RepID=A0A835W3S3_CHLIN|nr:hypothetical protein HXX76_004865 [Chlamydomonas incerta]|eukprot:KAG2439512.1 hypothetical protein HXX76_004865 [Chlamydomonas incerta]